MALLSAHAPGALTVEDRAVIEATVSEKERKWGHRIWLVEDTLESSRFDRMLSHEDRLAPYVQAMLRRDAKSVKLQNYTPTWAALTVTAMAAKNLLKPDPKTPNGRFVNYVSLPGYNKDHTIAALCVASWTLLDGTHEGGGNTILKMRKVNDKWRIDSTIRAMRA